MKHIWTILCKKSITDSETNMISLFDSFEQVDVNVKTTKENIDKPISIPMEYEVVSYWIKDKDEDIKSFFVSVEFLDPDLKSISVFKQEINFPENLKRIRTRIKSPGLSLTKSGTYIFKVGYKIDDKGKYKDVIDIPLDVILHKDTVPQTQAVS